MKTITFVIVICCFLLSLNSYAQTSPAISDAKTIILDHCDLATAGTNNGTMNYNNSMNGLNKCLDFSSSSTSFVKYQFPNNLTNSGTVEMWVNCKKYNTGLLNINWTNTNTSPSSGHVLHLTIDNLGYLKLSGWSYIVNNNFSSTKILPLNSWTHIAVSWGDSTKIYINGKLDIVSALQFRPAISMSTNYAYLPYWGSDVGYIDEVHISNAQRTNAEIASRVPIITQMNENVATIHCSVYSNPSNDIITLKCKVSKWSNPSYCVYDYTGKLIYQQPVKTDVTTIDLRNYSAKIFIIELKDNHQSLFTTKLCKN